MGSTKASRGMSSTSEASTRHQLTADLRYVPSAKNLLTRSCHPRQGRGRERFSTAGIHSCEPIPEVGVGDHVGGLLERGLGVLDQERGTAGGSAYASGVGLRAAVLVGFAPVKPGPRR
jgi:hypothetical protein